MRKPDSLLFARAMLVCGALLGLSTVAMGAVAAHLPDRMLMPGGRGLLQTAVQMQGWHVAALLGCGLLLERRRGLALRLAGVAFVVGIGCFCAGLYGLAFAGPSAIGRLAPVGGTILMLGWGLLAVGCVRPPVR